MEYETQTTEHILCISEILEFYQIRIPAIEIIMTVNCVSPQYNNNTEYSVIIYSVIRPWHIDKN